MDGKHGVRLVIALESLYSKACEDILLFLPGTSICSKGGALSANVRDVT